MKTLIYSLLLTLFSICLIAACNVTESDSELLEEQSLNLTEMKNSENIKPIKKNRRAVPFKASFFTEINEKASGFDKDRCRGKLFNFFNVQEGYGEATHLGRFSTRISFCVNTTSIGSTPYNEGVGTFIAANGDELNFEIEGEILPTDHPDYDLEFQDPFIFTGGTGRFAGASGKGITDSFHNLTTGITDHSWTGKLILNRGK